MAEYRLDTVDELPHSPTTETNFNESVYVNGWDAEKQYGGWMRIGNRVNEGHAEMQLCFYLPSGIIACQFLKPPIFSNEKFKANGLEYEVIKPFKHVCMNYNGPMFIVDDPDKLREPKSFFRDSESVEADITFELYGNSPVYGGEPIDEKLETMYGRDFSLGHFFQHTITRGVVKIGKVHLNLDGYGWRDHSWGPRYWTNIFCYRLLIANFGAHRGFTLLKLMQENGEIRTSGVLLVDNQYESIKDLEITTNWNKEFDPLQITVEVKTEYREAQLKGRVLTLAPLRNRRKVGESYLISRIAEGLTEWTWEGEKGIGISEYIERLKNGKPVGYPN